MCPICTVGLTAGVGLSRWLRVDDVISGLWIGALILALAIWTFHWALRKLPRLRSGQVLRQGSGQGEKKPFWVLLVFIVLWYLLTFVPMHYAGLLNVECQKILGLNRLVFGAGLGVMVAAIALWLENFARKGIEKKRIFSFQKVIIPIVLLLIASFILQVGLC